MKNKKDLIAQISHNLAEPAPAASGAKMSPAKTSTRPKASRVEDAGKAQRVTEAAEVVDTPKPAFSGKQAAFWLDDEDRSIFHETGMLLYSQGIKPSHNLVLRAAIRMIPRDHRLVEKVRELIEKDGRKVRHQKK